MLPELARVGVTEPVLVDSPPADPAAAARPVTELANRWRVAVHSGSGAA